MSDAKIQVTVGSISFSGEGPQEWLEKQLDKILASAPDLLKLSPEMEPTRPDTGESARATGGGGTTLAAFLTKKGATTNQVKRFLATAEWLHAKGKARLAAKDVGKALLDNHQKRLANSADCLNKNVTKGFCEKDGSSFYVTPEGRTSLG